MKDEEWVRTRLEYAVMACEKLGEHGRASSPVVFSLKRTNSWLLVEFICEFLEEDPVPIWNGIVSKYPQMGEPIE